MKQAIKFTLFSISAGIIQAVTFALLEELPQVLFEVQLNYWLCYLPALILSVVWNFTFNRKFTFQSAVNVPIAMLKVLGYYAVFPQVSTILGELATQRFGVVEGSFGNYVILAVTMLTNFVTEFLFDKYVVFTDVKNKEEEEVVCAE